ncbi:MAG: peptidyl-prolyl cis-trans isomerase [Deltaproteobacteria bacterium]|nr:peptidyl-prolyl cis-trans isomerase [Deltaproteobacteria bacterium]HDZ91599.1 hypothetical protein [Deltaproteobacteria bacterium]
MIYSTIRRKDLFTGFCLCTLICWTLAFLSSGCGPSDHGAEAPAIIIGSTRLSLDQLKREMEFIGGGDIDVPASYREEVRRQLIEQVIDYYLIIEYGNQHNISVSDEEFKRRLNEIKREYSEEDFHRMLLQGYVDPDQWERRLRDQLLVGKVIGRVFNTITPPGYEEVKAYFNKNSSRFKYPETVRFRQIVCRSKGEAKALRDRIRAGEDMGELAAEFSIAPEADARGEVGWVARGELVPSMEEALFSMEPGTISPVIKTPFGYHLLEVISRRPAGVKGLPEVIDQIESRLLREKEEAFYGQWVKKLRSDFKVEVNRDLLNGPGLS